MVRNQKGERNNNAKISDSQVLEIHGRYRDGESLLDIARSLSVTKATVYCIIVGKNRAELMPSSPVDRERRLALTLVRDIPKRFWNKVDKSGDCWVWTGMRNSDGYGMLSILGEKNLAHRVSYEIEHGSLEDSICVLHRCDNPPCVNPGHLFLGTSTDNNADRYAKGRSAKMPGEKNGRAKLSSESVRAIRGRHANGELQKDLAIEFGVAASTISWIVRGKHWKES